LLPEPKSRRTTPSAPNTRHGSSQGAGRDDSDFSGLSADDEDGSLFMNQLKARQRQREAGFRIKREQEAADAYFARQLQQSQGNGEDDRYTAPSSTLPLVQRPSQPKPHGFTSRVKKEQEDADAYLARQLQDDGNDDEDDYRHNVLPRSIPQAQPYSRPEPAFSSQIHNRPTHLSQPNYTRHSYGTGSYNSSPDGPSTYKLPTHVKQEPRSYSPYQEWQDKRLAPGSSRMPGSFDIDDDPFAFGSARGSPSLGSRPGSLYNGSANPLGYGHNMPGSMATTPFQPFGGSNSLNDIIRRTNYHDWQSGLDMQGQPLPYEPYGEPYVDHEKQIRELLAGVGSNAVVSEEEQADTPEGFHYPLYLHQKIALKWMQGREADDKKNGGILADDMGLGKTITTLALMMSRKAQDSSSGRRTVKVSLL
jgi:hypothetical protein